MSACFKVMFTDPETGKSYVDCYRDSARREDRCRAHQ